MDLSPDLVNYSKKRAQKEKVAASFMEGNATKLPFKSNSFDVVFVTYALHHFPSSDSLAQVFDQVFRVLKPGGIFYALEPNGLNPLNFIWWLKVSPERILPLKKAWRENEVFTVNETIIYPWQVTKPLGKRFINLKLTTVGFVPKFGIFRNKKVSQFIEVAFAKTPLINKIGGSFIVTALKSS